MYFFLFLVTPQLVFVGEISEVKNRTILSTEEEEKIKVEKLRIYHAALFGPHGAIVSHVIGSQFLVSQATQNARQRPSVDF